MKYTELITEMTGEQGIRREARVGMVGETHNEVRPGPAPWPGEATFC